MNQDKKDKRATVIAAAANNNGNNSNSSPANFQYKPPNNAGTIIGIIGGALSAAGDALATIGAIIQLETDVSTDFESQIDGYNSDQEKNQMQAEINDLQEKVKQLEELIKNNQNPKEKRDQS